MIEKLDKSSNCVIELNRISKNYRGKVALANVTLKWNEGILGLIGPNGAGKSTLIKILSTTLRPNEGYVKIFGKNLKRESFEVRKMIGVLFENPMFHPNLRVFSSLRIIGALRGLSYRSAESQALELLEYFDLKSVLDFKLKQLSAGMRQKYGLIYATLGTPPLIILDEPTSNLDPDARQQYLSYVQRLKKEFNCNFIISSHVLSELNHMCDGFAFIFKGIVQEFGKREELKRHVSSRRFCIQCKDHSEITPHLISKGVTIESIDRNKIIVKEENIKKIFNLLYSLQSTIREEVEIIPLETELETLYRLLREKHQN